jgi:hypothetical protein
MIGILAGYNSNAPDEGRNQNPNLRSGINESWICDHAAPQASTEEGQIIVCEACLEALDAGARIVKEQ